LTDAYNKWILEGPHKKYVTTQFGTGIETDPVLRAVDEAHMDPFNLRHERNAAADRRSAKDEVINLRDKYDRGINLFNAYPNKPDLYPNPETSIFYPDINQFYNVGELTARTPAGQKFENAQDYILSNRGPMFHPKYASAEIKSNFPISEKLKIGTPIYDVVSPDMLDDTGLKNIKKHLLDKLVSGEISPEKIPSVSVESVVKDMLKTQQENLRKAEKDKNLYFDWRSQNHQQLPADVAFTDADGNPTGAKMVVFNADMADANPDLVIRNLSQDTKELNHCVGSCGHGTAAYPNRHVPMVEPHTGTTPKGSDASYGPNYIRKIKEGEIEIASLRGPNGESKATLELVPDVNKDGDLRYKISQIKGEGNGKVKPEDVDMVKNWLNSKGDAIKDNRVLDLDNLPGVMDLRNTRTHEISDVYQTIHPDKLDDFFHELIDKKLEGNELTKERYNAGYIDPFQLMSDEIPRFVTVDDLKKAAEKNGFDIERRPEDKKTTGDKTNGLNEQDRLILESEVNNFFDRGQLPDDFADFLPDYQEDVLALIGFNDNFSYRLPQHMHMELTRKLLNQEEYRTWIQSTLRDAEAANIQNLSLAQHENVASVIRNWLRLHPFE
jgi:hypothetical protein